VGNSGNFEHRFHYRFLALGWLPMVLAALGALIDEKRSLGFTIWRSACRSAGLSIGSIAAFTIELLPTAVAGALVGGLLVLLGGVVSRASLAPAALAAHTGCLLGMPAGLLICASSLPLPVSLAGEAAITTAGTLLVWRALRAPVCCTSR
jgi:hypothetical protein